MKGLKLNKTLIYNLIIIALVVWIYKLYDKPEDSIVIPSQENTMTSENPVSIVRVDSIIYKDSIQKIEVLKVVEVENPLNEELFLKYEEAVKNNDSLKLIALYYEAITERQYKEIFEDSVQIITVESEVIGTLKSQSVHYRTSEKKIVFDPIRNRNSLFVGGFSYGIFEEPVFGANINLLNKEKNKIFTLSYDTKKRVHLGFTFKLF